MNTVSLFSSIGGLDLGLERAGCRIVAQVELDELRRAILRRHWPHIPQHDDVNTFSEWWQQEDRPNVELVAGGPPCQPFSQAGVKRGVTDERWQWPAMADAVRLVRPRFVLMENVPALLDDGVAFGWILADLADLGFDAEWTVLSACAMGAPHTRARLFLVAHTDQGDGPARMGTVLRQAAHGRSDDGASTWRDRVAWSVEASRSDDRDDDGLAPQLVEAGGDAVVPVVGEYIGRLIVEAAA